MSKLFIPQPNYPIIFLESGNGQNQNYFLKNKILDIGMSPFVTICFGIRFMKDVFFKLGEKNVAHLFN